MKKLIIWGLAAANVCGAKRIRYASLQNRMYRIYFIENNTYTSLYANISEQTQYTKRRDN
ncbi:hypothetical protein HMPREF1221_02403 [Treponema socranskii subsp. paredis ATCC 35535]|nr:hypothetical protein HMPREF1221_02403 [Treponema socranskii subsp. paredis ATCC 35535]